MTNVIDHIDKLIEQYKKERDTLSKQLKTEENEFAHGHIEGRIMTYTIAIVDLMGLKLLYTENEVEELKKEAQDEN